MKIRIFLFTLLLSALVPSGVGAEGAKKRSPDEVLVVCNGDSAVSQAIANDYIRERKVPHLLPVSCQDSALDTKSETITLANYRQLIESPVRDYLASHPGIQFIVLTKGIPIRISGSDMGSCDEHSRMPVNVRGHPSVDSTLAALDYTNQPDAVKIDITGSGAVGLAYSNRFWNATEPFAHAKYGGYLVTRLDGYTEAEAKALVRQALAAEQGLTNGKILFDAQPIFGLGDKASPPKPIESVKILRESPWGGYNADMRRAHDLLVQRGVPDELDVTETFIGGRTNLLGYFSWGSNDARYSKAAYQSLFFAPGSLSDTARLHERAHFSADERRTIAHRRFGRARPDLRQRIRGRTVAPGQRLPHHRHGSLYLRLHHGRKLLRSFPFCRLGGCCHRRSALLPLREVQIGPCEGNAENGDALTGPGRIWGAMRFTRWRRWFVFWKRITREVCGANGIRCWAA